MGSNPAIPTLGVSAGPARPRARGAVGSSGCSRGSRLPAAPCPPPSGDHAVKSDVETLDATTVKLTVEVTGEELKPSIDHAYQAIGAQVQVPGFRKGKVPTRIIDQRVGRAAVVEQAVNEGMATFYRQAITEAELRPLGQPEIEVTEISALTDPAGGLTFTAQVEVRPDITLPDARVADRHRRRRRGHRRGRRRAPRLAARAVRHARRGRPARRRGRLRGARPVRQGRRRRGRRGQRHLLRDRLGQHARRPGRGARRPLGRRDHGVRDRAGRWRARRRDRHRDRHPDLGQGPRPAGRRRRLRPARLRVRHARGAAGRPAGAGRRDQGVQPGRPGPRQAARGPAREASRSRCPPV